MVVTEDLPDWLQEIADEPSIAGELELTDFAEIPAAPTAPSTVLKIKQGAKKTYRIGCKKPPPKKLCRWLNQN